VEAEAGSGDGRSATDFLRSARSWLVLIAQVMFLVVLEEVRPQHLSYPHLPEVQTVLQHRQTWILQAQEGELEVEASPCPFWNPTWEETVFVQSQPRAPRSQAS